MPALLGCAPRVGKCSNALETSGALASVGDKQHETHSLWDRLSVDGRLLTAHRMFLACGSNSSAYALIALALVVLVSPCGLCVGAGGSCPRSAVRHLVSHCLECMAQAATGQFADAVMDFRSHQTLCRHLLTRCRAALQSTSRRVLSGWRSPTCTPRPIRLPRTRRWHYARQSPALTRCVPAPSAPDTGVARAVRRTRRTMHRYCELLQSENSPGRDRS